MDIVNLNSFLKFGYFIAYRCDNYQLDFSKIDKSKYLDYSEKELVEIGKQKFIKGIEDAFSNDRVHVVPISGGLDSRAILAVLMDFVPVENIRTYTFGTPGTMDYEIGNFLAKKLGTDHHRFPLTEHVYSQKELVEISHLTEHQTVLFHHPPLLELKKLYSGSVFWSGYIGDAIAGGHIPKMKSRTIDQAKLKYIDHFTFTRSMDLTCCKNTDFMAEINAEWIDPEILSFEEQLLYQERCQKLTAPHVLAQTFEYKTPFINNEFMDFMLSLEEQYRKNQNLYRKLLIRLSKELFSYKTKTNFGLPLNANKAATFFYRSLNKGKRLVGQYFNVCPDPGINYLDFNRAIKNKKDLSGIIYNNIQDLKHRKIVDWIDVDTIWDCHIKGQKDHSDALLTLASLEIHLKIQA